MKVVGAPVCLSSLTILLSSTLMELRSSASRRMSKGNVYALRGTFLQMTKLSVKDTAATMVESVTSWKMASGWYRWMDRRVLSSIEFERNAIYSTTGIKQPH